MTIIEINDLNTHQKINIGRQGTSGMIVVAFYVSSWYDDVPDGEYYIHYKAPGAAYAYELRRNEVDGKIMWPVNLEDTQVAGNGELTVIKRDDSVTPPIINKSVTFTTVVTKAGSEAEEAATLTVREVINEVMLVRPHDYDTSQITNWLNDLDLKLYNDVVLTHDDPVDVDLPHDTADDKLLFGRDARDMYINYVLMQIDMFNAEYTRYNNDAAAFEAARVYVTNKYHRTHKPIKMRWKI